MRATIRDTEIYFDIEGAGLVPDGPTMREKPAMFALHGGPGGDHSGYKPALSPLAENVQIVYVDHRGQGRSARGPQETYTLDNNVEDLEALRQHLGLGRVVVLGISYGGMVALAYAARYPQHVSHLIACVTVPDHTFLEQAQRILAERGSPEQQRVAEALWAGNFQSDQQLREYFDVMGPLYSRTFDAAKNAEKRERAILSYQAINQGFGGFLRSFDLNAELPNISARTLVIGATHDWICPPEYSQRIAQAIPRAELRMFENSGHSILADDHAAFIAIVRGFLTYNP
ncbi:MAG: alpha/beta fold hydrolase [Roseiflexaceae bacterium]|nr:alpha/beta fold hydrolase [Roseiflexaceae bacterium]